MRKLYSLTALFIICVFLLFYRISYSDIKTEYPLKVTTWDALGYYMYLPGIFIYNDVKELKWFNEIDDQYSVSGGYIYQAQKCDNGNYFFKYLCGVSVLESPFFFIGHIIAKNSNYKADGFSPPYQYAIAISTLIYCLLGLFLLRNILLRYFKDLTVAITLLFLMLATNIIQYVAIDSAQSHGFIFPLYVLILYVTIKWHEKPQIIWAALAGFIIGLATISRPTEAIMLFIPLLWSTENKEKAKRKWNLVKNHKIHLLYSIIFGLIAILPQLIYWKHVTGSIIFDVGSKWDFLTPHLRVIFGWEKGWIIYTPITIFFIAGFFFMKKYPFKKSVITFCILNIYIIIAWHDWRYGGSYSARALVHSYPVFALPFATFIEKISLRKWRFLFYILGIYLIYVNLFQIKQYNNTVLHYDHMNRKYYGRIYLDPHPNALDMSLLDNKEYLRNEKKYNGKIITTLDSTLNVKFTGEKSEFFIVTKIDHNITGINNQKKWLKIEAEIKVNKGFICSYLNSYLQSEDLSKHNKIRLFSPISQNGIFNNYAYYIRIPDDYNESILKLYITSCSEFDGTIENVKISYLTKF